MSSSLEDLVKILLNTQHYKVVIKGKGKQSREMSGALSVHLGVVAIEKGASGHHRQSSPTYLLIYIYMYINIFSNRKAVGHCSMVRFKEECPPHRIDCPLGRKLGGSTRAEEKPPRDTVCRLRGKGLDMPCDSY